MTTSDHPIDLLAVHALDAIGSSEERERIDRHVAQCPRCRQELDAMRGIASALGNTVDPPPERLWTGISSRLGDGRGRDAELHGVVPVLPEMRVAHHGPTDSRRHPRTSRAVVAALAVAAVMIGALTFSLVQSNNRVTDLQSALRDPGRAAVSAALAAPGRKVVELRSAEGARLAEFVLLPSGAGFLVDSHMAPAPPGRSYELWAVVGGRPIPVGLMGPVPSQVAFVMASVPRPSALAVTVEPPGGSIRPTTTPVGQAAL